MEIRWKPHALASFLHAADAMGRGVPLADSRLAEALRTPAEFLAGEIAAAGLPAARFWRQLLALSAEIQGTRMLTETAVAKTIGRAGRFEAVVSALAAAIAAIEAAGRAALPDLTEELELRERPLREQWEARGPGLLFQLANLTDERLLPESCTVVLVHPALGGAGEAHLTANQVRIEAVLANPHAELPEVVRLGWLIGQLQLDLPIFSEQIHPDRLPHIARLALLPPILTAAETVELAAFNPHTLQLAVNAWRLTVPADLEPVQLLMQWWQTCQETQAPWPVALAALGRMIG